MQVKKIRGMQKQKSSFARFTFEIYWENKLTKVKKMRLPKVTNFGGTLRGEDTTDLDGVEGLLNDSVVDVFGTDVASVAVLSYSIRGFINYGNFLTSVRQTVFAWLPWERCYLSWQNIELNLCQ